MSRFVKKPDVIDAMQFDGSNAVALKNWIRNINPSAEIRLAIVITTQNLQVPIGSWVVSDGTVFSVIQDMDGYDAIEDEE